MRRVTVEKESRAAFLHLKESRISEVDAERLMQNVLIIDIGSSTTDFTIVSRMQARPIEDFGLSLGAGLIEEMIYERTLLRMEKETPDELQRLEDVFQKFPHFKRQCLIACREGKEKYFSIPELYLSEDQPVDCSLKFRTIKPPIEFEPCIHRDEMEKILALPIKALNGQSWKEAFLRGAGACQKQDGCGRAGPGCFNRRRFQNGRGPSALQPGVFIGGEDHPGPGAGIHDSQGIGQNRPHGYPVERVEEGH